MLALSGGGFVTYSQDVSAGGTILYTGPTSPFANVIKLTGSPSTSFVLETPSGTAYQATYYNNSGQPGVTVPVSGFGYAALPNAAGPVTVNCDGSHATGVNQNVTFTADILPVNMSNFTGFGIQAIGSVNTHNPGQQEVVPIYGTTLNRQDSVASGVTPPAMGDGPVSMQVGDVEWEAVDPGTGDCLLTYGRNAISQSGVGVVSNPEIRFASARGSQRSTKLEGVWGDTLTGPSASGSYVFDIPPGTTMLRIKATAAITVAGGSDTVGDAFATETTAAWANVSSVVTQLTADRGEPFEFFNPAGNMAGTSFGVNTSGTQAYVSYGTNGTIDPGTSVDFQIWVEGVNQ